MTEINPKSNTKSDNFEQLLKNYLKTLDEVIDKLKDLLTTVASHHNKCNIAKTAGTAVSSTGVAMIVGSVVMSPFTGGGTIAVGVGGAVMSLTGGISNVVTDLVDYQTTQSIVRDIKDIINSKEKFDENLKLQLKNFGKIIEKLIESGVDKDSAIVIAVKGIANGCIDLTQEPNINLINTLGTIVKLHHVESVALDTLPVIGKTLHMSERSFQFIYNFFGLTGQTVRTIGRIASVISVAFAIADIALLIKDWNSEHPTVEVISETEKKLKEEKLVLSEFLEVIVASKDDVESVLEKVMKDIEAMEEDNFESEFVFVPREIETS